MPKFNPATDVPKGYELAGMSQIPESKLVRIRELQTIRRDAMDRYHAALTEVNERVVELNRQFVQADKVLDGKLIELTWEFGWTEIEGMQIDEDAGILYGFKRDS